MATVDPLPDWVEPGQEVYVLSYSKDNEPLALHRRVTVSRVGPRYVIVADSMGNEQKFFTTTLSKGRRDGGMDVLRSPLDPAFLENGAS